jgi:hypothetical protein
VQLYSIIRHSPCLAQFHHHMLYICMMYMCAPRAHVAKVHSPEEAGAVVQVGNNAKHATSELGHELPP